MSDRNSPKEEKGEGPSQGMRRGPRMMMGNVEKANDPSGALRRLLSYLGPYRLHLVIISILTLGSTLLSLAGPYLVSVAIDEFIVPRDFEGLVRLSGLIAGVYIVASITDMFASWVMATISQKSLKKLRGEMFEHIQTLSLGYFDRHPAGDLMSRLTNDVDAIGAALSQNVTQLIRSFITLVGIIAVMFRLNIWLALASLFVFPIMVVLTALIGKRTRASFRGLQRSLGQLNSVMQENITGQKVVIAFSQQQTVNSKFEKSNNDVKELGIQAMTYAMLIPPLMGILSNANIAIVAGLGSWMALQGLTTIGTISAFITYSRQFANPLRHFANLYNSIQSALAGAERIFEVLDTAPELTDAPDAISVDDFRGEVKFKEVDFSYVKGIPVLKDIDLEAYQGQTVALVGPTGAGKTTIVNVLTRFYEIQDGSIQIDGNDIREIKKDALRNQLDWAYAGWRKCCTLWNTYSFRGSFSTFRG
jgi:ATP-binding cassette subfamily B protein